MSGQKQRWRKYLMGLWLLHLPLVPAAARDITSLHITEHTLAALPQCLHHHIKGVCYWLSETGATVTTPAISHALPDLVISVFNPPHEQNPGNPWVEIRSTLDQAGLLAQKEIMANLTPTPVGGGEHGFTNDHQHTVFFKEVDVIGNPALSILPNTPLLLPSTAQPLKPYFQSMVDTVLWRGFPPFALPEQAYALAATHYVGSHQGMIHWGGIYPFSGKVNSSNDAKAAAVIALRAGILLTASHTWGHIHQSLATHCGTECNASVISENDASTQLQRIYPDAEHSCRVLGKTARYGEDFEGKTKGNYVWVLWRTYEGCVPGPGVYLGKTIVG